jgi:2-polyprenyl-3-methyl-5-hydroxy-6-metoxy-1,4-benzoquinol methylase
MNYVKCNLCGQDDWLVRFSATLKPDDRPEVTAFRCTNAGYGQHPQIVECRHCGLVYANPRWPGGDLIAAYAAVEDETYVNERAGRELTFSQHLRDMERVTGPADGRSLLDVGAYIGVFVDVARQNGWQATGVEPSRWAAAVAQRQGLPVLLGTQHAPELQGQRFDVITMWDVIEHVDDPAAEIRQAYQLLQPGGLLVIHTMDVDSLAARLMGPRWPWLMDMHIYYFSQATLAKMLQQNGFTVIKSGAVGRYLRLGYLGTRVAGLSRPLGNAVTGLIKSLHLAEKPVWINFGDLFTVYAQRPPTMG